jgi:hypothetical protein
VVGLGASLGLLWAGVAVILAMMPAGARAAEVVMLGPHGESRVRNDPFLTLPADTPPSRSATHAGRPPARAWAASAPPARARTGSTPPARARAASTPPSRSVARELGRLRRVGAISSGAFRHYSGVLAAASTARRGLRGTRGVELGAVLANLSAIASAGRLTVSRLPALFITLERNRLWWTTGPLLGSGQRVEFAGSEMVWEYYPGQGIELQPLGSFGKANGLYTAGRAEYPRMVHLLSELIPLAAARGRGIAWEYYFSFDGGIPPWTSAMSQATAIESLTRAYRATRQRSYLATARRALPIFTAAPPVGVSVRTSRGRRYLLYSFAPGAAVINGFLQTLIGLFDFAHVTRDPAAAGLFAAGDAEAQSEVPRYDTGAWSLYEPGQEATLDYHVLVTGFLHALCDRVHAPVYCQTAAHFDTYLKTPPALGLLTRRLRARRSGEIAFRLSKASHVGIVVSRNGQTRFLTSADFSYGIGTFFVPALTVPGVYSVRLAATDLAGNFNRIVGTLQVTR